MSMNNKGFHSDPISVVAAIFVAINKPCEVARILKKMIQVYKFDTRELISKESNHVIY